MRSPRFLLTLGLFLMLLGIVLPFMLVVHILESTFFLNFIAFASQVAGLFLGTIGIVFYAGAKKR